MELKGIGFIVFLLLGMGFLLSFYKKQANILVDLMYGKDEKEDEEKRKKEENQPTNYLTCAAILFVLLALAILAVQGKL